MKKQKRQTSVTAMPRMRSTESTNLSDKASDNGMGSNGNIDRVDVSKNFSFVTNFGKFKVSELMCTYVFEGIFPILKQFFFLRIPMK
jgi:hypothetical protein